MRILFIIAHIGKGGGQAIQACRIIRGIIKRGHNCKLLTLKTKENLLEEPCNTQYCGELRFPRGIYSLKREIKKCEGDYDIVQCFDYEYSLPAVYLSRMRPYLIRLGMNPYEEFKQRKLYFYYPILKYFLPKTLRKANYIIVNSKTLKNDFDNFHTVHIPNGYDPTLFSSEKCKKELRYELKIPKNKKILIFTGKVIFRKNLEIVFDILSDFENIHFLIVGNINEEHYGDKYYKYLIKKYSNLKSQFTFLGEKKPEQVIKYLLASDIFIFPSILEGSPNSVLEAMLCKLPVICYEIKEHKEFIKHDGNGFLFLNKTDLKRTLIKLISDTQTYERVSSRGFTYVLENHDITMVIDKYIELYAKTLNKK